jgi:Rrf2 family protein
MSMSSRFVVAVHALTLLAGSGEKPLTSGYLAGSINTSPIVVRRILGMLRRAKLVAAQPGVGGGSRLARGPERITLRDVYRAVEAGELFSLHPQRPNQRCPVGGNIQASLDGVLSRAQSTMEKVLGEVTMAQVLADVMKRSRRAKGK